MTEPSLPARIWEFAWVLLYNWKGGIATACLVVLSLPQFLSEKRRASLDAIISPEGRRKLLIALALPLLLIASFQAYDDLSTRNRVLSEELAARDPSHRNITEVSVSPYRAKPNDDVLNVITLPMQIILPADFPKGKTITVKDMNGEANAHPIIITAEGGKIDNVLPAFQIVINRGSNSFIWDGRIWSVH
jgi:hypothetical protein